MSTQTVQFVEQSFRLRRSIQIQGIVFTLFFLTLAIACVSVAFLDDPSKYGFKGEHAVAFSVAIGILFWGGWALLGVYTLLAYYVEQVTIARSTVAVRSVFQNRRFDVSEIVNLTWKSLPGAGRLVLSTENFRTKLDLYGFCDEDRLTLVRQFRRMIPEDKQTEWPMFCHKIAIPLRDRRLARNMGDATLQDTSGDVFIAPTLRSTGGRIGSHSAIVAYLTWWITASPIAFAVPACLPFFWLQIRFSVRAEGEVQSRLTGSPGGYTALFGMSMVVVSGITAAALRFAGYSRDTGCTAGLLILVPTLPIFIYGLYRADRQQKREADVAASLAPGQWDADELSQSDEP